ncbi:class I SAM-dependent methyltransferase [Xenorhabdus hominickii]|uniref:Methylase n=1 Tax=Xenorhabdus hominickii TaxID=351679 RepID=A0A2G0Q2V0_XENHO|nr:class I SAM-dependent methyltransferase [Xenorhabdus hominickii]AOM39771.1 methylase [Xenorhabdus hominickii]PHM53547.1 methylase involved in ubiquinone/menaquinone biosynthesis [Xenorhabdus hominickii]
MNELSSQQIIASNRDAWNDSAKHHKKTAHWNAILREVGQSDFSCLDPTLTASLQQVGVAGKDVLQLGCNNGRESLSLFALGARSVVGVDQSSAFLEQAGELNRASPHHGEFIEADIHHLPQTLHKRFDVALITIGVLNWMPDIRVFFAHVASTLKVGGSLVVYETHPFLEMLDPKADEPFALQTSYFRQEPFVEDEAIVYEGTAPSKAPTSYWFVHPLGDIVSAAIDAGLQITHLKEYPHSNREQAYDIYEQQNAQLPMCYTMTARKT